MLDIILVYFVGKTFHKLAKEYGRTEWQYAVLGIGVFLVFDIGFLFYSINSLDYNGSVFLYALVSIAIGLLACFGLYSYLKMEWKKTGKLTNKDILDDTLFDD